MKKADRKLKPLTPKELVLTTGGVVPVVLGRSTFDYVGTTTSSVSELGLTTLEQQGG
jgi:hypothetical protein